MATAIKQTKRPQRGGQFRVLVGEHVGDGPAGCQCDGCLQSKGKSHVYRARKLDDPDDYDGDVVDSPKVDLVALHNQTFSRKFERVEQLAPPKPIEMDLEQMTLAQLLGVAQEEGVKVEGLSKKPDVLKAIKEARDKRNATGVE